MALTHQYSATGLAEGKSSRGLEQSKTLRVCRKPPESAERLGVRWPSTAFPPVALCVTI